MDQNDYYLTSDNFQQFLNSHDLNFNDDISNQHNSSDIILMEDHINKLHTIIFQEISKNGISSEFLLKLKKEINSYSLNKN